MKKIILLFTAVLCGIGMAAAQDLIIKKDASKIEAKVTEVTPDAVRYKRFSNPDGPTYSLPVAEIEYIQYVNGEKDLFDAPAVVPAAPLTPAVQVAAEPSQDVQYVLKRYEIGEYYDRNGLQGVVCSLDETRQHGLLISLDEKALNWSVFRRHDYRLVEAGDSKDGVANMESVAAYIAANNLSWDDFPAFKWCREKGEGWYLPAIDEMLTIGHNYNGGTRMRNDRQARNKFNDTLKEHGGERMAVKVYYFSSTESDEKSAFTTHMNIEPPYVEAIPKSGITFLVRAVHKF